MIRNLILACLALTLTPGLGCAAFDGGGGAGDTSSAPTSLDNVAAAAVKVGGGLQAAGAAAAPANPAIGAGLTAAGTIIAGVGGLLARRKLIWGTVTNRRAKRRQSGGVWTEQQRQAVRLTLAANAGEDLLSRRQQGLDSPPGGSRVGPGQLRAAA